MSIVNWFRTALSSLGRKKAASRSGRPQRRKHSIVPQLEAFEERLVPTQVKLQLLANDTTSPNFTAPAGSTVKIRVNVNQLQGPEAGTHNPGVGISGASIVLMWQTSKFAVDANWFALTPPPPTGPNPNHVRLDSIFDVTKHPDRPGWQLDPAPAVQTVGDTSWITIGISNNQGKVLTLSNSGGPIGGTLVNVDFKIASNVSTGSKLRIDLAKDTFGGPPTTSVIDAAFHPYDLNPSIVNNTDLSGGPTGSYSYGGPVDGSDALLTVGTSSSSSTVNAPLVTSNSSIASSATKSKTTYSFIVNGVTFYYDPIDWNPK